VTTVTAGDAAERENMNGKGALVQTQDYTVSMLSLRKAGAFVSLLLVLSMPAMACFDHSDMTVDERECCQQMAEKCGSMEMPQSHSCCTTKVQSSSAPAIIRNNAISTQLLTNFGAVEALPVIRLVAAPAIQWLAFGSPPISPPQSTTILSI